MRRRQTLESLLAPTDHVSVAPETSALSKQVTSGALKAMGMTLRQMSDDAGRARELQDKLQSGERVIDIEPGSVDASFAADRIAHDQDREFDQLVESIRDHGQQVPILVRPHPEIEGKFQVAYGHRRLRAAQRLSRPVKAVVRRLSDAELVVAQGKENLERQDLSFIERAKFAHNLEAHGFDRKVIMAALGVAKGDLSSLISVARGVPKQLIEAIGPAPKIGKPRWMELAEKLAQPAKVRAAVAVAETADFAAAETNRRFLVVLQALNLVRQTLVPSSTWTTNDGLNLIRIVKRSDRVSLHVDETAAPSFSDFLIEQLPDIYSAFRQRKVS